ncbi:MAG: hypothetical protein IBX57_00650 [Gammaproteobacteria bacterium]|nr:hypothetical protein [Gammaproteobacteria bacterium]
MSTLTFDGVVDLDEVFTADYDAIVVLDSRKPGTRNAFSELVKRELHVDVFYNGVSEALLHRDNRVLDTRKVLTDGRIRLLRMSTNYKNKRDMALYLDEVNRPRAYESIKKEIFNFLRGAYFIINGLVTDTKLRSLSLCFYSRKDRPYEIDLNIPWSVIDTEVFDIDPTIDAFINSVNLMAKRVEKQERVEEEKIAKLARFDSFKVTGFIRQSSSTVGMDIDYLDMVIENGQSFCEKASISEYLGIHI